MKQNEMVQQSAFGRLNLTLLTSGALWVASVFLAGMAVFALREVLIWGVALVLAGPDRLSQLRAMASRGCLKCPVGSQASPISKVVFPRFTMR